MTHGPIRDGREHPARKTPARMPVATWTPGGTETQDTQRDRSSEPTSDGARYGAGAEPMPAEARRPTRA